jgi:hypothetical protein
VQGRSGNSKDEPRGDKPRGELSIVLHIESP